MHIDRLAWFVYWLDIRIDTSIATDVFMYIWSLGILNELQGLSPLHETFLHFLILILLPLVFSCVYFSFHPTAKSHLNFHPNLSPSFLSFRFLSLFCRRFSSITVGKLIMNPRPKRQTVFQKKKKSKIIWRNQRVLQSLPRIPLLSFISHGVLKAVSSKDMTK